MSGPVRELVVRGTHALRRSGMWWGIGIVSFTLANCAFWPSFENSEALDAFAGMSEGLLEAFGAQNIASPAGYMDGQAYALLLPLLLSGMAIAGSTAITSGDEDAGRLELLHALPIDRRTLWLSRFASAALVVLGVSTATGVLVAATLPVFSLDEVGAVRIMTATLACGGLAVFHASVGYTIGAVGGSRGVAAGGSVLVLVLGYVCSVLLPMSSVLRWARNVSPWYWAIGEQPVTNGIDPARYALLVAVTAVVVAVGTRAVGRRDIRSA